MLTLAGGRQWCDTPKASCSFHAGGTLRRGSRPVPPPAGQKTPELVAPATNLNLLTLVSYTATAAHPVRRLLGGDRAIGIIIVVAGIEALIRGRLLPFLAGVVIIALILTVSISR